MQFFIILVLLSVLIVGLLIYIIKELCNNNSKSKNKSNSNTNIITKEDYINFPTKNCKNMYYVKNLENLNTDGYNYIEDRDYVLKEDCVMNNRCVLPPNNASFFKYDKQSEPSNYNDIKKLEIKNITSNIFRCKNIGDISDNEVLKRSL
tara:strand:- start:414 stop:860 length:447 start_codon:yes stop_codon:yes gene_type:complete